MNLDKTSKLFKIFADSGNFLYFKFTRASCGEELARIGDSKQIYVGVRLSAIDSPTSLLSMTFAYSLLVLFLVTQTFVICWL